MINQSSFFFHDDPDPEGLRKVINTIKKKNNITSYKEFALKIAKLPRQLFDESSEIKKKKIEEFDRTALITYAFCLAKPTVHSQCKKKKKKKMRVFLFL